MSTFITDLKPFENFLNRLSVDFVKDRIAAHSNEQFNDFLCKQDYEGIIKGLKAEIVGLLTDQHTLVENYIKHIHTKFKRSLIPIIGKGLSYLFGTATEYDLNTICVLCKAVLTLSIFDTYFLI